MKKRPKKVKEVKIQEPQLSQKLKERNRMPRTFSFMTCQIRIQGQVPESTPPEWEERWVWVSVRLDDTFYKDMAVRQVTGMLYQDDVKRQDPNAYFIPEYQTSDAVKKGFVHKLNITLIPQDPDRVDPFYGSNFKTTIVVSGAFQLQGYIQNILAPFIWRLGPDRIPYISKPRSISPVGGRKNKETFA